MKKVAAILALAGAAVSAGISGSNPGVANLRSFPDEFVTIQATNGELDLKHEIIKVDLIGQTVNGHVFSLNPAGHFHVYTSLDGCPGRTTTKENAAERGCHLATNAGFFNMQTGACMGEIVSDETIVSTECLTRAGFGLTHDGKMVAGYVNETTVASGIFEQYVQGSGWLVRNGVNNVENAFNFGEFTADFRTLLAPRLAAGWTKDGHMMLLEVDGIEADYLGLDLDTFTDLLISYGFVEAVNLDGGGSVTIVWDKHVCTAGGVGFEACDYDTAPTDEPQADDPYERPVTTITCFK